MQLHQLEYLVAVADDRSFTRAADRLRVAQPGVSAQVRKLERELGHTLLDRPGTGGRGGVEPTEAGFDVVAAARAALAAVSGVRQVAEELSGLVRGHVRAGAVTSGPFLDVPEVLADFADAHPGVEVTLAGGGSADLLDRVRSGQLDVALVGLAGDDPPELEVRTVTEEVLVLVVAQGDILAGAADVDLADVGGVDGRAVVAPLEGSALRVAVDAAFASAGVVPRMAFEAGDPGQITRMVARGLGVAVLPRSVQAVREGDLVGVPLRGTPPRTRLALVWRGDPRPSPAARALTTQLVAARR